MINNSVLSVRPMREEDIAKIIGYWSKNQDDFLTQMGTDKQRLPGENQFATTLQTICNTPFEQMKSFYMIWLIDNKPVGYNGLKDIVHGQIAHMHLHMWHAENRGKGYGAKLFCLSALEFYKLFNLKMILCEPRASNPMPNKMLAKVGFKIWKKYVSTSSDISLTCENNSYIIDPKTATDFLNQGVAN